MMYQKNQFKKTLVFFAIIAFLVLVPISIGSSIDTATVHAQTPSAPNPITSCSIWNGTATFDCWFWIPFMSSLGSWFLTIGGSILLLTGYAFDTLLQLLVIDFGNTIQSLSILEGVQWGWQLFRDLANIAIIGVFVFVAIMTILGSSEYGAKRLISHVLIVAVLINFSFLFTRMVIESTNFVSGQFARNMPAAAATPDGEIATARSFLQAFGITDVWGGTSRLTQRAGQQAESGWAALLYGFVGGIALLAIALVLLYGAIVISARALLLIFAMLTSAIAFASFLLPNKTGGLQYIGWSTWWSNLLKAALFGPLLMVFLWITMAIISQAANTAGAGNAISAIADNPATAGPNAWAAIVLLIIGTGMLYVAIRAASSFASSIGGFNWAAVVPAFSTALLARTAAFAGRQTVGRGGAWVGGRMQEASKDTTKSLWTRQLYDFSAQQFKGLAKQDMNLMRTTFGKEVHGLVAGVPGLKKLDVLAGKAVKGFEGSQKARAERYAEQAERMGLSKEETKEAYGAAIVDAMKRAPELGKQHTEASAAVREGEKQIERLTTIQAETVSAFEKNMKQLTTNLENATLRDTMHSTERSKNDIENIKDQMNRARTEHTVAMQREKQRIEDARLATQHAQESQQKAFAELHKVAEKAGTVPKTKDDLASALANKRFTNVLKQAVGVSIDEKNDELAKLARKEIGERTKKKDAKTLAEYIKTFAGEESHAPAKAPQPASTDSHAESGGGTSGSGNHH